MDAPIGFVAPAGSCPHGGVNQDTAVTFNTSMNLQAIVNGASSNQYVNATSNPVGSPGANGWVAQPIELGANAGATFLTADVYEVSVWSGAFTTTATTGDADKMCHNQVWLLGNDNLMLKRWCPACDTP
jgi:hypothetical protein